MRMLAKLGVPAILAQNGARWLAEYLGDRTNQTKRYRYRHPDIKSTLIAETHSKCVYCESRVGHNAPGDVEHMVPTAKDCNKHFTWTNLTIACPECNRRKRDFYNEFDGFLDPYVDNPDSFVEHKGPVVTPKAGQVRGEIFVRTLQLCSEDRWPLFRQKIAKLNELSDVLNRYTSVDHGVHKEMLRRRLREMAEPSAEYSAMVRESLRTSGVLAEVYA